MTLTKKTLIFVSCASLLLCASINTSTLKTNAEYEDVQAYTVVTPPTSGDGCTEFSSTVYFGDSYFDATPTVFNSHLASASAYLMACSVPGGDITKMDREEWYKQQPKMLENFLTTIGFTNFKANEDYTTQTTFDTIGVGAAYKEINVTGGTYTLIACAPRSGQYFAEWANNFYLGDGSKSDYMHEGWYNAANKEIKFLQDYVEEYHITGKVKLWLAGFSRGGAVTNLTAALLDNKLDKGEKVFGDNVAFTFEDLYAYTYEAPQGANIDSKTVKAPKDEIYNNIWNIINPNDVVPKVAMSKFGFTRFGRDRYIKTKFYDPENFETYRATFNKLYEALDENIAPYTADDFEMHGLSIENFGVSMINLTRLNFSKALKNIAGIDPHKANYDANLVGRRLLDELCSEIGSRKNYATDFQGGFKDLLLLFMGDEELSIEMAEAFVSIPGAIATIIIGAIGYAISDSELFLEAIFTAFDWMMPSDVVKTAVHILAPLLTPLCNVYWDIPNEIISIGMFAGSIFQNHYTEVVIAHMQAQDTFYIDAYNKNHQDKVAIVPLFDNADYGRMHFFGFNDLGLRLDSSKGQRIVNVEGHLVGKSDIKECSPDCAVGYYSYITEEKMELYFPVGRKYNISMKSYSKKPRHRVEYWADYMYFTIGKELKNHIQLDHKKETVWFNSDRYKRDVNFDI